MSCMCSVCGIPVECGDTVCGICECSDGIHCDIVIEQVKPNLFKVKKEDGSYALKWIPQPENTVQDHKSLSHHS